MLRALALFCIRLYAPINIVDLAFIAAVFNLSLVLNIYIISEVSQGVNLSDTLHISKTQYTDRKHNKLIGNTTFLSKTQYIYRENNTFIKNRSHIFRTQCTCQKHSQRTEYTFRKCIKFQFFKFLTR